MEGQSDPNIGQVLDNRYQLMEVIGQGSMGKVYRAEDQLLGGVPVAVKFLSKTLLNENMRKRFGVEAKTGAQLGQRSIHIVRVLDYGLQGGAEPYYVMEFMEGKNLSDLIIPQPLSLERFLQLSRHICLGLECAHNGIKIDGEICKIVHRDIKPSNVFVISDPSLGEVAKVLDFGIAKLFKDTVESNQTRSFMGTLAYCSPEQIEGKDLDARSDIYSLGITMFETITGEMPIEPDAHTLLSWYKAHRDRAPRQLTEVAPHLQLPQQLDDLIMSCMEKSPGNRPQSAAEMASVLQALQDQLQTYVPPKTTANPATQEIPAEQPDRTTETTENTETPQKPQTPRSKITRVPSIPNPQQRFWSIQNAGWEVQWPNDKPVAEIVFPRIIETNDESALSLWLMLSQSQVKQRELSTRYNQFLLTLSPHPMILWITVLYDPSGGAKWLPCYLDMKQERSHQFVNLLANKGYYMLLFFASEDPAEPSAVKTITVSPGQRHLFLEWLKLSKQALSTSQPSTSKQLLKAEFERIKPSIINKLELASRNSSVIL